MSSKIKPQLNHISQTSWDECKNSQNGAWRGSSYEHTQLQLFNKTKIKYYS